MVDWDFTAQVTGSNATASPSALTDITGLSYAAAANSLYEVEAFLIVSSSDANGCKYTIAYSAAGATGGVEYMCQTSSKSAGVYSVSAVGTASTQAFLSLGGSTKCAILIRSIVAIGANTGNITVQHSKLVTGTATAYIGSVMKVRKSG